MADHRAPRSEIWARGTAPCPASSRAGCLAAGAGEGGRGGEGAVATLVHPSFAVSAGAAARTCASTHAKPVPLSAAGPERPLRELGAFLAPHPVMVPPVPGTTGPAELTSGERGQGSISSGPLRALAWHFHCAGRTVRPPCCRSVVSEDNISPSWSPREGNHPGCPCCQSCWVLPAAGAVPSRGRGCARAPLQGPDRGAVSPSSG